LLIHLGTTGNFEVTILSTGELIHSKKTMGHGKCESKEEREKIKDKIRKALESAGIALPTPQQAPPEPAGFCLIN